MSFYSTKQHSEFQIVRFTVDDGTNLCDPSLNIRGASYSINTVWHLSVRPFDDCTRLSLSLVFVCHSFATAREGLSSHSYVNKAFELELVDKPLLSGSLEYPAEGPWVPILYIMHEKRANAPVLSTLACFCHHHSPWRTEGRGGRDSLRLYCTLARGSCSAASTEGFV